MRHRDRSIDIESMIMHMVTVTSLKARLPRRLDRVLRDPRIVFAHMYNSRDQWLALHIFAIF